MNLSRADQDDIFNSQMHRIGGLSANQEVEVGIVAIDVAGNRSEMLTRTWRTGEHPLASNNFTQPDPEPHKNPPPPVAPPPVEVTPDEPEPVFTVPIPDSTGSVVDCAAQTLSLIHISEPTRPY